MFKLKTTGGSLTSNTIKYNFQQLENYINYKLAKIEASVGQDNAYLDDLNMNNRDVINVNKLYAEEIDLNGVPVQDLVDLVLSYMLLTEGYKDQVEQWYNILLNFLDNPVYPSPIDLQVHTDKGSVNNLSVHGSTSSPTANKIVQRDSTGNAEFESATSPKHAANKTDLDNMEVSLKNWVGLEGFATEARLASELNDLANWVDNKNYINTTDYATSTVAGALKVRLSGTTLYISSTVADA